MSETEKIWLGFALGLIGTTVGAIINHIFGGIQRRQERYSNAVTEYKTAFAPEIADIANNCFCSDVSVFTEAYFRHKTSVDNIRPILPKRYQRKLQEAWDEYRGKDNNLGFDDEGFIHATSATLFSVDQELFNDFKKRFKKLHNCLDDLL